MAFQTPITIKKALDHVHRHEFVLPAIQREFVWKPKQIERLFDSLMRGYPIGSFLFWRVDADNVRQYKFYDFVLNYHQRDAPHCPPLTVPPGRALTAVLDGQQRLTAINIGLRGSHASKQHRLWSSNPKAFPSKRLYLNLAADADDDEDGKQHDFRFLTDEAAAVRDEHQCWYRVGDIVEMDAGPALLRSLEPFALSDVNAAFEKLYRLHRVVHLEPVIAYFEEESQDLDKVLNIFIRTNSGGTVLSYSDLLLSIATAQWDRLDARHEIHTLVDELNRTRGEFRFSKDLVLKAGLMLADIGSVGFKVTNFNNDNMTLLEEGWHRIADALRTTVRLIAEFGFSGSNLSAQNAVLPIAYYIHQRGLSTSYLTSDAHITDRDKVRRWLTRSLLKSGVWGSGMDTLLTALRATLKAHGGDGFPSEAIEATMRARGKRLTLEDEELQDLTDMKYGDKRAFPLLSLAYPFVDFRNEFHVDHVFPRSRFTDKKLQDAGIALAEAATMKDRVDRLPNLQLLDGPINKSKNARMPAEWMAAHFPSASERDAYVARHDLGEVPESISEFNAFYERRRERLQHRLKQLLGVEPPR